MNRVFVLIFSAFLLVATPALGRDSEVWKVRERAGEVHVIRQGLQPIALASGGELRPGDIVATGAGGRAVLSREADYVIVSPLSRVQLPPAEAPDGITRFFQQAGTLLYKVRRMGAPHFQVRTNMLAAVVKGTTFTVVVSEDRSAVQVTEGAVEVTAITGGMKRLVMPGEAVFIDREDPSDLILASHDTVGRGSGEASDTVWIEGTAPVPLSSIADLTAGLIREAIPSATQVTALHPTVSVTSEPAVGVVAAGQAPVPAIAADVAAPAGAAPQVAIAPVTTPQVTLPVVATPEITVPALTTPEITVPAVTTPQVTVPALTTPQVTVPAVTTPQITVPEVTAPIVTTPQVTVPAVTTPQVTVPAMTTPQVTVPALSTPQVTVPAATTPQVTLPPVTAPSLPLFGGP